MADKRESNERQRQDSNADQPESGQPLGTGRNLQGGKSVEEQDQQRNVAEHLEEDQKQSRR